MFNSTHTLLGISLSRGGMDRWAPHALWTAVIASNLPDIDIVTELHSTTSYIEFHRGITHTIMGVTFLSLALAAVMHLICGGFRRHLAIAAIIMSTHPALDYLNTYGVRPLAPWNNRWFYGDVLFVIDPYVDLLLLGGILLGIYSSHRRAAALISCALVLGYIAACVHLRNLAEDQLAHFAASIDQVQRSAVSPEPLNPFSWTGIVETPDAISMVDIDVFGGVQREVRRFVKAEPSAAIETAERTRTVAVFNGFARFPITKVNPTPEGYRVQFVDVRYYRPASGSGFAAEVLLDPALHVLSEDIGFNYAVDGN